MDFNLLQYFNTSQIEFFKNTLRMGNNYLLIHLAICTFIQYFIIYFSPKKYFLEQLFILFNLERLQKKMDSYRHTMYFKRSSL